MEWNQYTGADNLKCTGRGGAVVGRKGEEHKEIGKSDP